MTIILYATHAATDVLPYVPLAAVRDLLHRRGVVVVDMRAMEKQ